MRDLLTKEEREAVRKLREFEDLHSRTLVEALDRIAPPPLSDEELGQKLGALCDLPNGHPLCPLIHEASTRLQKHHKELDEARKDEAEHKVALEHTREVAERMRTAIERISYALRMPGSPDLFSDVEKRATEVYEALYKVANIVQMSGDFEPGNVWKHAKKMRDELHELSLLRTRAVLVDGQGHVDAAQLQGVLGKVERVQDRVHGFTDAQIERMAKEYYLQCSDFRSNQWEFLKDDIRKKWAQKARLILAAAGEP